MTSTEESLETLANEEQLKAMAIEDAQQPPPEPVTTPRGGKGRKRKLEAGFFLKCKVRRVNDNKTQGSMILYKAVEAQPHGSKK